MLKFINNNIVDKNLVLDYWFVITDSGKVFENLTEDEAIRIAKEVS